MQPPLFMRSSSSDNSLPSHTSDFTNIEQFRDYTTHVFEREFKQYILKQGTISHWLANRENIYEFLSLIQANSQTRGRGIESWLILLAYDQCCQASSKLPNLSHIVPVAVAFYATFAAYEIIDDLFDDSRERRGKPSLWTMVPDGRGPEFAVYFSNTLFKFAQQQIEYLVLEESKNEQQEYFIKECLQRTLREAAQKIDFGQITRATEGYYFDPHVTHNIIEYHKLKAG